MNYKILSVVAAAVFFCFIALQLKNVKSERDAAVWRLNILEKMSQERQQTTDRARQNAEKELQKANEEVQQILDEKVSEDCDGAAAWAKAQVRSL